MILDIILYVRSYFLLVHISRQYPVGKFDGEKEAKRWREIVKEKLNPHIRYRRLTKKNKK